MHGPRLPSSREKGRRNAGGARASWTSTPVVHVTASPAFHLTFDGKHNANLSHEGPFTTSTAFWPSRSATDVEVDDPTLIRSDGSAAVGVVSHGAGDHLARRAWWQGHLADSRGGPGRSPISAPQLDDRVSLSVALPTTPRRERAAHMGRRREFDAQGPKSRSRARPRESSSGPSGQPQGLPSAPRGHASHSSRPLRPRQREATSTSPVRLIGSSDTGSACHGQ